LGAQVSLRDGRIAVNALVFFEQPQSGAGVQQALGGVGIGVQPDGYRGGGGRLHAHQIEYAHGVRREHGLRSPESFDQIDNRGGVGQAAHNWSSIRNCSYLPSASR